jgi:small subunit ribosomal protein S17
MATTTAQPARSPLTVIQGVVSGTKMNKTIKVSLNYQTKHAKYGKYLSRRTVLHVHDEKGEAREGDTVEVAECRPISKTKHHRLVRIVTRGNAAMKAEEPSKLFEKVDPNAPKEKK